MSVTLTLVLAGCFSAGPTAPAGQEDGDDGVSLFRRWTEAGPHDYAFRLQLHHPIDPGCVLDWRFAHPTTPIGLSLLSIRRNMEGNATVTWAAYGVPAARIHMADAFDSEDVRALAPQFDGPSHARSSRHETMAKSPFIDHTVVVRGFHPEGSHVRIKCQTTPETFSLRVASAFHAVSQATSDQGASASVCPTTCSLGFTVAKGEGLTAHVQGDLAEVLFLTSGQAIEGELRLEHPEGTSSWTFPTPHPRDTAHFEGPPGQYRAEVDIARIHSDTNGDGYNLVLADWVLASSL